MATVLVTGASKGIGRACIEEFALSGYNLIIHCNKSKELAEALKKELQSKYPSKVLVLSADITKEEEVQEMMRCIKKEYGKLDVLINNAAYASDNSYIDKTFEEFMQVLKVNVGGTFLVTKYAATIMKKGIVINISSLDATTTYNALSMDYCASKAGVNNLTKTFSLALPENKYIALMLPWVNTEAIQEMNPEYLQSELKRTKQRRLLEPKEVALKVLEIIKDESIPSGTIMEMNINDER